MAALSLCFVGALRALWALRGLEGGLGQSGQVRRFEGSKPEVEFQMKPESRIRFGDTHLGCLEVAQGWQLAWHDVQVMRKGGVKWAAQRPAPAPAEHAEPRGSAAEQICEVQQLEAAAFTHAWIVKNAD